MKSIFLHIDYNSYFATVEQQANPRLRGKPIAVTWGDRMERTVVGAASIEAKALGVKTGMPMYEALKICPELIMVRGDSDKYLACTKRFLNILKDYSPNLEVFSIDEAFLELKVQEVPRTKIQIRKKNQNINTKNKKCDKGKDVVIHDQVGIGFGRSSQNRSSIVVEDDAGDDMKTGFRSKHSRVHRTLSSRNDNARFVDEYFNDDEEEFWNYAIGVGIEIKERIRREVGEWISVSTGISYNKTMAKLAGSFQKPDGLYVIGDEQAAMTILDQISFDDICGIGGRTKRHLFNMGICDFTTLRRVPLELLLASFKSYGKFLYDIARGENFDLINRFYEKEEVKSVGHQHTLLKDTNDVREVQQTLLKISEMIAKRLRDKKLVGRKIVCFFRYSLKHSYHYEAQSFSPQQKQETTNGYPRFESDGMQMTIEPTDDGLTIFKAAWRILLQLWDKEEVRLLGISVGQLQPKYSQTLSLFPESDRSEKITKVLDKVNDRFGDFTLQRGILLNSTYMRRKPNPFMSDRRFKVFGKCL